MEFNNRGVIKRILQDHFSGFWEFHREKSPESYAGNDHSHPFIWVRVKISSTSSCPSHRRSDGCPT